MASQQKSAKNIILPLTAFFHCESWCLLFPTHIPNLSYVCHHTKLPSSIALWSTSESQILSDAFSGEQE